MNPENPGDQKSEKLDSILNIGSKELSHAEDLRWSRAEHILSPEYSKGHIWMGYYTPERNVGKIFEEGLKISDSNLMSTAVYLNEPSKSLEEQSDSAKQFFVRSGHWENIDMIIIDFNVPDDDAIRRADSALAINDRGHSLLPREYIRGSWNVANGVFTANPNFEQRDMPIRELPGHDVLMGVDDILVNRSARSVEIPEAPKDGDVPDIW